MTVDLDKAFTLPNKSDLNLNGVNG